MENEFSAEHTPGRAVLGRVGRRECHRWPSVLAGGCYPEKAETWSRLGTFFPVSPKVLRVSGIDFDVIVVVCACLGWGVREERWDRDNTLDSHEAGGSTSNAFLIEFF